MCHVNIGVNLAASKQYMELRDYMRLCIITSYIISHQIYFVSMPVPWLQFGTFDDSIELACLTG
jgi:hypothetical protein